VKSSRYTLLLGLVFSLPVCGLLEAQSVYISIQPFDHTGVEEAAVEDIIYLLETRFRGSALVALVPKEQQAEFMEQDQYELDGSIRIKPIQLKNMFGRYKVIRGRLDVFAEHYSLSAEMVDTDTKALEASFHFKGTLHEVRTAGVNGIVAEFSSRLAKLGL